MPIFAGLFLTLCNAFASVFVRLMGIDAAIKLAAYMAFITILVTFVTTVAVCLHAVQVAAAGLFQGGGGSTWLRWFFIGLGMFIPPNAGAILSCYASVWLASNIARIQSISIRTFQGGGGAL